MAGSTALFPLNTINSNFKGNLKFYFYSFIFSNQLSYWVLRWKLAINYRFKVNILK